MGHHIRWVAHDQDREDQKVEEKAERRAMRKEVVDYVAPDARCGRLDPNDAEYETVEEFVEFLCDDDRTDFTFQELACLNIRTGRITSTIRMELETWGFLLRPRPFEHAVRGHTSNCHNRWTGNN